MTKRLLLISILIAIAAGYALGGDGLKLRIKTVEESRYKASIKSGELTKDELEERVVFIYDEDGRLIEETRYNFDSGLNEKVCYRYDGDRIEQISRSYDSAVTDITVYAYDERGNKTETKHLAVEGDRGNLYQRQTYVYDDKGNLIESKSEGAMTTYLTDILKYDETGKLVEKTHIDLSSAEFNDKTVYRYDEQGKLIGTESYDDSGSLSQKEIYSYNERGEKIETYTYTGDGSLLQCETCSYSETGKMIETEFHKSQGYSYSTRRTFQYDERGNLLEDIYSHSNGSRKIYVYKYDSEGNRLETLEYIESVGDADIVSVHANITERKIFYNNNSSEKK